MDALTDSQKTSKILRSTLLPEHLVDPTIIKFIGNYVGTKDIKQASDLSGITYRDGKTLFNRPDIYKAITEITKDVIAKFGFDAEQVVERVKEIAFSDVADLFDPAGKIFENIHDIPPETRRAIKKFKYKSYFEEDVNGIPQYKGKIYEVELWDKPRTLELLGREKDTFKKTNVIQHDVSKNAAEFLLGSVKRADAHLEAIDVTPKAEVPSTIKYDAVGPLPAFKKPKGAL